MHIRKKIPETLRRAVFLRDKVCRLCGCDPGWNHRIDHIVAYADGGPTIMSNLRLLCRPCERERTSIQLREMRKAA
jgi:5-methylcytosine-specific restriction endonuclease McrA